MKKRFSIATYIILVLFAIGVFSELLLHPLTLLIPAAVFGIIFLLYKFPPNRFRRTSDTYKYNAALKKQKEKSRTRKATFRVIEGNKGDHPEEPPKYH